MTSQRQNFQAVRKKAGRFDDDDCDVGTDDVVLLYDVTGWYFLLPKPEFPLEGEYLGVWRRELRGSPSDLVPLNFRSMYGVLDDDDFAVPLPSDEVVAGREPMRDDDDVMNLGFSFVTSLECWTVILSISFFRTRFSSSSSPIFLSFSLTCSLWRASRLFMT